MLHLALSYLGIGVIVVCTVMLLLWLVQRHTGNAAIVDVGWTFNLSALALLYAYLGGLHQRGGAVAWLLAVAVSLWAARLGGHLWQTRIWKQPEEGRYQQLRRDWAPHVQRSFFLFYQAQALLDLFLSLPFLLVALDPDPRLGPLECVGLALSVAGVLGEAVADHQLERFKRDPGSHGRTCRRGLWGWSRHPNYFFEVLVWIGWALVAHGAPWGFLAWLCPAAICFFIFRVTGIPATEAQALRSRGDDYRRYQREVSVFIPLPPKRGA